MVSLDTFFFLFLSLNTPPLSTYFSSFRVHAEVTVHVRIQYAKMNHGLLFGVWIAFVIKSKHP